LKFATNMELENYIHSIRDRCAHTKSSKDILGVTQLSRNDIIKVSLFLPFLTRMCVEYINDTYKEVSIICNTK